MNWHVGPPAAVKLVPDKDFDRVRGGLSPETDYGEEPIPGAERAAYRGARNSYSIPLGKPILIVDLSEGELPAAGDLQACLNPWLDLDYRNIAYRQLRVPYVAEWVEWEVNRQPTGVVMHRYYDHPQHDKNVPDLLRALSPAITSLLLNLRRQGQEEKIPAVAELARIAQEYGCLDGVATNFLDKRRKANEEPGA